MSKISDELHVTRTEELGASVGDWEGSLLGEAVGSGNVGEAVRVVGEKLGDVLGEHVPKLVHSLPTNRAGL